MATDRRINVIAVTSTALDSVAYGPSTSVSADSLPLTQSALFTIGGRAPRLGTDWSCTLQLLSVINGVEAGHAFSGQTVTAEIYDRQTGVLQRSITATLDADQEANPGYFNLAMLYGDATPVAGLYAFSLFVTSGEAPDDSRDVFGGGWFEVTPALPS